MHFLFILITPALLTLALSIFSHEQSNKFTGIQGKANKAHVTRLTILEKSSSGITAKVELNYLDYVGANPHQPHINCQLYTNSESIFGLLQDAIEKNGHVNITFTGKTEPYDQCHIRYLALHF